MCRHVPTCSITRGIYLFAKCQFTPLGLLIYWVGSKRKGSKPIHGRTNSKNISRNTKYKDTVTYYLMNCLLSDITLWLGIMNQFHSLDVLSIPVS